MSEFSVFTDKAQLPTNDKVQETLGENYVLWKNIEAFVLSKYLERKTEWNFPGKKYGWSYRIKDKRRAIIYFLPLKGYFKVAFVFGEKAMAEIVQSSISPEIIEELQKARKYAEGRGIRIEVRNDNILEDIKCLVEIKLKY